MLAAALAGVVTYALLRDPSYVALPPVAPAAQARPAEAAVALQSLTNALDAR